MSNYSRTYLNDEDHLPTRPLRELLAISVIVVGSIATVTWMAFLVLGFRWLGASGFNWFVSFV